MYQEIFQSPRCFNEIIVGKIELLSIFPVTIANSRKDPDKWKRLGRNGYRFYPQIRQLGIRMALKTPPKGLKRVNIRRNLKEYTYLGCPMTKNRTPWCFRMCKPNAEGTGLCGRLAPHGFKSHIQQGIEDYKKRQADSSTLLRYKEPTSSKDA